jgi:O-antigen/teichoic acid export membrane protein
MAVLGFFFWVIVARFYTEAEVGYSGAIISAIGLVALIGRLGLESVLIRFFGASGNKAAVLNTCLTYAGLVSGVAGIICVLGLGLFSSGIGFIARQPAFFIAFVLFAIASSLYTLVGASFVAMRRADYVVLKDAVFSSLKLVLPLVFIHYFHAFGIVASWGLASAAGVALSLFYIVPRLVPGYKPWPHLDNRLIRRTWGYSGMSYLINMIAHVPKFLMPIIVINALGPVQNGYFYVAWAIYSVLGSIPTAVSQSMFAEVAVNKRALRHNIIRSFALCYALLIPACLIIVLFGERMMLAFGASYSENSVGLLRVLVFATLPLAVIRIHFSVLRVSGRMREMMLIRVAITIVAIVAAYVLVPQRGIEIIGWIWLVAYTAAAGTIFLTRSHLWRHGDGRSTATAG